MSTASTFNSDNFSKEKSASDPIASPSKASKPTDKSLPNIRDEGLDKERSDGNSSDGSGSEVDSTSDEDDGGDEHEHKYEHEDEAYNTHTHTKGNENGNVKGKGQGDGGGRAGDSDGSTEACERQEEKEDHLKADGHPSKPLARRR